jgi:hypothetical protein
MADIFHDTAADREFRRFCGIYRAALDHLRAGNAETAAEIINDHLGGNRPLRQFTTEANRRFVRNATNHLDHLLSQAERGYARGGAVEKLSKAESGYRNAIEPGKFCALCSMFEEPDGCTLVEGKINRTSLCDRFEKP